MEGLSYLALAALPLVFYLMFSKGKLYEGFPVAGLGKSGLFGSTENARKEWFQDAAGLVNKGLDEFRGCFQVITSSGAKIILPGKFAQEIRNDPNLSFINAIQKEFFGTYAGFEVFSADYHSDILAEMVRGRLTQSLNFITPELSDETAAATHDLLGRPTTWENCQFKPIVAKLVARVSSRVFVGPELCANEDWLDLSVNFTFHAMEAVNALSRWPAILQPMVHGFLPEVRKTKDGLAHARRILEPVFEERRAASRAARESEKLASKASDTIGWFDEAAKGRRYDVGRAQLGLSFAAIHTTSELISGVISDLCDHPEWIERLREEMSASIKTHGWSKRALQDMRLTDSLMKESQRHHFGDIAAMHRVAVKPIKLSDGTLIPKGAYTMVALDRMNDTNIFENPSDYNPRRFLDMRGQPGQENKWQFVTTSPEHLAFGHGKHSCPGRFFASNEVKVILVHLLMKYDWQWASDGRREETYTGLMASADPSATAMIKVRDVAVDI